jgi:hypothetical protein
MTDQITSSLCISQKFLGLLTIVDHQLLMNIVFTKHLFTINALRRPGLSAALLQTCTFGTTPVRLDFHFDTHHFVQRLEREGLNRAQAEGIMSAMAEVIDESIRNMTSNMVTKADQEKVHRLFVHVTPAG